MSKSTASPRPRGWWVTPSTLVLVLGVVAAIVFSPAAGPQPLRGFGPSPAQRARENLWMAAREASWYYEDGCCKTTLADGQVGYYNNGVFVRDPRSFSGVDGPAKLARKVSDGEGAISRYGYRLVRGPRYSTGTNVVSIYVPAVDHGQAVAFAAWDPPSEICWTVIEIARTLPPSASLAGVTRPGTYTFILRHTDDTRCSARRAVAEHAGKRPRFIGLSPDDLLNTWLRPPRGP